ncbi:hypothetical protein HK101_005701 [Irineochytrium annulatum]|nr:hypothetical protein HK101_005701 [Irineochytrium annulatum]
MVDIEFDFFCAIYEGSEAYGNYSQAAAPTLNEKTKKGATLSSTTSYGPSEMIANPRRQAKLKYLTTLPYMRAVLYYNTREVLELEGIAPPSAPAAVPTSASTRKGKRAAPVKTYKTDASNVIILDDSDEETEAVKAKRRRTGGKVKIEGGMVDVDDGAGSSSSTQAAGPYTGKHALSSENAVACEVAVDGEVVRTPLFDGSPATKGVVQLVGAATREAAHARFVFAKPKLVDDFGCRSTDVGALGSISFRFFRCSVAGAEKFLPHQVSASKYIDENAKKGVLGTITLYGSLQNEAKPTLSMLVRRKMDEPYAVGVIRYNTREVLELRGIVEPDPIHSESPASTIMEAQSEHKASDIGTRTESSRKASTTEVRRRKRSRDEVIDVDEYFASEAQKKAWNGICIDLTEE